MRKVYTISASILSANFACLGEEVKKALVAGADVIHFDVMDNHYVPNLTIGPLVCKSLRDYGITAPIDVHLMTKPVDSLIVDFAKAGATYITFHPEATEHIDRSLQLIHANGCLAGLAFNPATPLCYLEHVWDKLDMILLMSVNPGFGGQEFIQSSQIKITEVRELLDLARGELNIKQEIKIAVDGGVKIENIKDIANAGADYFVVGSALFHSKDYSTTIKRLREQLI